MSALDPPRRAARIGCWLAGDHHVHTQYSRDGRHTILDQATRARQFGLDWMVVTDHGGPEHVRVGVIRTAPDIAAARRALPGSLLFQGVEWNIPGAEHGTVFVAPGARDVEVLQQFERDYDGVVRDAQAWTPDNEALAVAAIGWLGQQVDTRRVADALMVANHPARQGLDSPHEIRGWRDTDPRIAVGFEGAPGHQAAGLPRSVGPGENRGYYGRDRGTNPNSFLPYPQEAYRTWGGFDWMTATVGGLWDSLLAEGRQWSITANSDSHEVYLHTADRPAGRDDESYFEATGFYPGAVYDGVPNPTAGDFWPGQYSRTVVGATRRSYRAVMRGLRDGAVWVDHGHLISALDLQVRSCAGDAAPATLGSTLQVAAGAEVEIVVRIDCARLPHAGGEIPRLNRVDLIVGAVDVRGPDDRDAFTAPHTRVVRSWDTSGAAGTIELTHRLGRVDSPLYVRVRGTDARFSQVGALGAAIDPHGPRMDIPGDSDPWLDLWFYSNASFVAVTR